jgi:hypothetical protein
MTRLYRLFHRITKILVDNMSDHSYSVYTNAFGETTFSNISSDPVIMLLNSEHLVKRAIFDDSDMESFKNSESAANLVKFIQLCADSVVGMEISGENYPVSAEVTIIVDFMKQLAVTIDETPPIHQPMRFGNKAFRTFHQKLTMLTPEFVRKLLWCVAEPTFTITDQLVAELTVYVTSAFGNEVRIDYGTGHELNMAVFFYCLHHLQVIAADRITGLILRGFVAYIQVMRKLQTVYMLEPAGSHGVWGLDDYHCLTFLWGAAQLCNHDELTPSSILDMNLLKEFKENYLFMEGIYFIRSIKSSAPFAETSPMLNDISAVPDWGRVTMGLVRLFQGEVLYKRPVVQHLPFGSILKCTWEPHVDQSSAIPSAFTRVPNAGIMPMHASNHKAKPISAHHHINISGGSNS